MLTEIIITSSRLWTVPLDWSKFNTIEVIGGGCGGGSYYRWWGGNRLNYGYGGSGAGYAKVQNLNTLVPGQVVSITIGAGGSGAPDAGMYGGGIGTGGGASSFDSLIQATGGQTSSLFPFQFGGNGSVYYPSTSFSSSTTSQGSSGGLVVGTTPGYGGNAGSPGYYTYGRGGDSQTYYSANYPFTGPGSTPGVVGVVRITYTPSGTQQACVWIS